MRVSSWLLVAGMLSFSFVATSCGSDDDEDPVEQVQEFTITYDANGGSGSVAPTKFKAGANFTLSDGTGLTAPEGKVFGGWSTSKDKEELDVTKITGNTTLYAVWKDAGTEVVTSFTITYDANGGTGTIDPTTIKAGEKFTISDGTGLTAPEGKVFGGWSTSKDKEELDITEITGDITLYAVWKDAEAPAVETVTITFDLDGGTSVLPLTTIAVEKGTEVKAADYASFAPTKEGYTFKGWATEKGGAIIEQVTVTEAATLYAVWEQNAVAPEVEDLALDLSTALWTQFCDVEQNGDGSVTLTMSKGDAEWQKGEFGFAIPADKQGGNYKKIVVKYKDATAQDNIGCVFHFDSESVGWANGEAANAAKFAFEAGSDVKTLTLVPDATTDKMGTVRIFDFATDNSITIVSVTAVVGE